MVFQKQQKIGDYVIMFPHKQSVYAETYRVKNKEGKTCFLKLLNLSKLTPIQFDDDDNIIEIEIAKKVNHKNLCSYIDEGTIDHNGLKFSYFVTEFVSGETLSQHISREGQMEVYEMKHIILNVLNALKYLHTLDNPVIHNEITIQNVMLDLVNGYDNLKLIDFGSARFLKESGRRQNLKGKNLYYLAPEVLNGIGCIQSDLFSVGVMMYHLLYGSFPWFKDVSGKSLETQIDLISEERLKLLRFPDETIFELDDQIKNTIKKALSIEVKDRFQSADEFIKAINGEIKVDDPDLATKKKNDGESSMPIRVAPSKGKGFSAIAGMQELKNMLQEEVINVLQNPEEYSKYGLTIPNGMLLYGPPGCGKTFFAKHFAEEVGFNFMEVVPSRLQSRYVNATQENIAKMFEEAAKNSPTIIFIDEINEIVPNREGDIHEMSRSAVNEMLAQMDRTGEKGIFIIGATNFPDSIDPAILRAGRIDKKYYLAPPDKTARSAMFELYLKNRPYDFGLDYDKLADLTENYVSADLELIVNNASREALKIHSKITMQILENAINKTKPSVSLSILKKYEKINARIEGNSI